MLSWLGYIFIGKLFIYLGMEFPLPDKLEKNKFIGALHSCDLCFGVYVYGILSYLMKMDGLSVLGFWYVPFISELVTGGIMAFLVHIFSLGWKAKFEVVELR